MPIYEYECTACGHRLEAIRKFSDKPLTECPACHKDTLSKQVSAPAFHLKGNGWYATDFKDKPKTRDDDSKKSSETSAKDTEKPASSTESKTPVAETTPAPKKTESASPD